MKRTYKIFWVLSGIGLVLLLAQLQSKFTYAQADGDQWFPPINISNSGGMANPTLVVDAQGVFHIIWEDEFAGFMYAAGDGQSWSTPQTLVLPFGYYETTYYFVADSRDRMHALWIDEDENLFYARTTLAEFTQGKGWTSAQRLARAAIHLEIITDANANIHIAYMRGNSPRDGVPAGIYYQRFMNGTTNWSEKIPIDQSPYLRTISQEEANIDMASSTDQERTIVYIAWDNTPKRQVYLAQSDDTGLTWNTPFPIGSPPNAFNSPYGIQIEASGDQAMILWRLTEPGATCSQQYLWTADNGQTWQTPSLLFDKQSGCPRENHLFDTGQGFLVFTILNEQAYFLAWNGTEWSQPQHQSGFTNLADPETNLFLNLKALQTTLVGETFYVIGFDSLSNRDIWSTGREIKETESWFPQLSAWTIPEEVAFEGREIGKTQLIADSTGRLHAFWNQTTNDDLPPDQAIYYSVWDEGSWSPAGMILRAPARKAHLHAAVINTDDVIYTVWDRGDTEGLTLSWADADRAYNPPDWITSEALPSPQWYATSPDICIDDADNIIGTYVLPLNEDRGVYFIKSPNGGKTWFGVTQVANAAAEGWARVDHPQITSCGESLEMLWTAYTLPPDSIPLALYAAHSNDGGASWSMPEQVTESYITWSDVVGTNDTFHRVWQEYQKGVRLLWHQISTDRGSTWNTPENILTTNTSIEAITTVVDPTEQLYLIFATKDASENTVVHHWLWENEGWKANESLNLGTDISIEPGSLASAIAPDGTLGIIYASERLGPANEITGYHLGFSSRVVEIPYVELNIILPTPTIAATEIPPTQTSIPEPAPTATRALPDTPNSMPATGTWTGLIAGGAMAFLLLGVFLFIGLLMRYRRGR